MPLQLRQSLLLFLAALIWGTTFVAQSLGNEVMGPFAFNFSRSIVGAVVLFLMYPLIWIATGRKKLAKVSAWTDKKLWLRGFICGVVLFFALSFQQCGLVTEGVGKAGFITSLYIVGVPVTGIFIGRKVGLNVWIAVILAVIGLYLLTIKNGTFTIQIGDTLFILCALFFTSHILVIDRFVVDTDAVKLSCIQFFWVGILSLIPTFLFETLTLEMLTKGLWCILYAGVLSSGIAYTLQIVGQKGLNPTIASLVMSLEAVISVLAGWFVLNEILTSRELIGCVVMGIAILIAQLPRKK